MLDAQPFLNFIGQVVREERERRGWSLADLAEHSLLTRAQVSQIERGQIHFTIETFYRLAVALEVHPMFLVCPKNRPLRGLLKSPEPLISERELLTLLQQGAVQTVLPRASLTPEGLRDLVRSLLECSGTDPMVEEVLEIWWDRSTSS